jgi:hypothetical protein
MASAALVALRVPIADPVIAIVITGGVILRITWESWLTVSRANALPLSALAMRDEKHRWLRAVAKTGAC